jgi:hypothetical protein
MGDIIISANQVIETTVSSIYAATPPVLSKTIPPISSVVGQQPTTQIAVNLTGINFRNLVPGDLNLIVPNGTCALQSPSLHGLGANEQSIFFLCDFSGGIRSSGTVSGPMLLSYFGGNQLPTQYSLSFSASVTSLTTVTSASVVPISNLRKSSGQGCGAPSTAPGNVCAVAAASTPDVPAFSQSPSNADAVVTLLPANSNPAANSVKFSCSGARSLTLGSFQYSIGSPLSSYATPQQDTNNPYTPVMKSIASCPLIYDPRSPVTAGKIASANPNYNIPYQEQQNLLFAVDQLYSRAVEFVIIKINGGGANLPGFFTLSLNPIYNGT